MRVFVTGGSGFIGERLVRRLLAAGHEVARISRAGATSARLHGHAPIWLTKLVAGKGAAVAVVRSARSSNQKLKALNWTPAHPRAVDALPGVIAALQQSDR